MDDRDEMSFEEIYRHDYSLMLRYCTHKIGNNDAEDIVSEAFILLYQKWDGIDSHEEGILRSWLFRAINFKCLEYSRKKQKRELLLDLDSVLQDREYIDSEHEYREYLRYLSDILTILTPLEEKVFECIVIKEMTIKETSVHLNKTQVNVRVTWLRIRKRLREYLKKL